ncbi:serine/threonine-protein kinase [Edaphobacter aggregans]|uniref:serine/threonine-protein kinase n=1 Tax=Edaphobacter aggregans TaxID=570835 RepID=UPI00068CB89C|nr:serine/threonine-protein kinase [Edaphobacter aggregans]
MFWLALLISVTTVVLFVLHHFLEPELRGSERQLLFRVGIAVLVLVPLAIIVTHRSGFLSPRRVLELSVLFEILVSFGLALLEVSNARVPVQTTFGISAVPLWILTFGIFVPNTPLRALLGAMISASTGPLAYALGRWVTKIPAWESSQLVLWFVPAFLMAGWTYFLSRDIYQMQVDISRAREMGSYSLEKMLGRGGMGEVWAARHRRLSSGAAVKLIRPEVLIQRTGREAHVLRRRFEQEARATARLRSPHTVALHDFGVSEDGSFYYAMELLEGLDLADLIERFGPQPPSRVVWILQQVCDSLAEAHGLGLIHRDIKPSNVFLARLGLNFDFVKVLDFGLVKSENGDESRLTLHGTAAGTPAYMAPELATGAPYDSRADLYSLGCVGYFLLTGTPVFEEPSPVAVALAHVQKQPVPPSQKTELSLPSSLEAVILRCLAKDPAGRPQSSAELGQLLADCEGVGIWTRQDAERWWRVHLPNSFSDKDSQFADALWPAT